MATRIKSENIADSEVKRADLNTTTTGSAVIAKLVAGTFTKLSSTGVDVGTGDVTLSVRFSASDPSPGDYIYADSNTTFAISPLKSANSNVDIHPSADITNSFGAANKRFLNIYAQNIYGSTVSINSRLNLPGLGTSTSGYGLNIGSSYTTQIAQAANTSQHFYIFHNSLIERNGSDVEVFKWVTSHPSFGSRGIRFEYGDSNASGIKFFADSVASTAGNTFTPTQRMIIANTGNVGIGVVPGVKLDVYGASDSLQTIKVRNSATYAMIMAVNGTQGYIGANNATAVNIICDNATRMYVEPTTGYIGIGVSSSLASLLHLKGGIQTIERTNATSQDAGIVYKSSSGSDWFAGVAGSIVSGRDWMVYNYGTSSASIFIQRTTGNVGVGTTSPGAALSVKTTTTGFGVINFSTSLYGGIIDITAGTNAGNLYLNPASGLVRFNTTSTNTKLELIDSGGNIDVVINSGGDTYFRGGNVGINVTLPVHKLDVDGTVGLNANYIYFCGDATTNGSWRASASVSGDYIIEARISGTWTKKQTLTF